MFICEFWDVFHNTSFLEHLGETAILCTSCRISTTRYSKKLQAFYARLRYSHSKAFIYLKSQKTVCDRVNLLWSCEMSTCKLMKKKNNSFTHRPSCILPSFSQNTSQLLLQKRLWKFESTVSFCNLPVQLRFIQVSFLHVELAFNVLLRFLLSIVFIKCTRFFDKQLRILSRTRVA